MSVPPPEQRCRARSRRRAALRGDARHRRAAAPRHHVDLSSCRRARSSSPEPTAGSAARSASGSAEASPPRRVRALVRSERAAAALRALPERARPEVAIVDYARRRLDRGAGARAATPPSTSSASSRRRARTAMWTPTSARAQALAAAADRCGLRRIVALSILGADARLAQRLPRLARARRRDPARARRRPRW